MALQAARRCSCLACLAVAAAQCGIGVRPKLSFGRGGEMQWKMVAQSGTRLTFLAIAKSSTRHTNQILKNADPTGGKGFTSYHLRPHTRADGGAIDNLRRGPCAGGNATLVAAWAGLFRAPRLVLAVVREPIARLLSEYSFNRTVSDGLGRAARPLAPGSPFVAAATRHAFLDERRNWQLAFLSGRRTRFPGPDGCAYCDPDWADPANAATRGDLEVLKRAARAGAFLVGPLERHGELLHVVAARMGWTAPAITKYDGAPRDRILPNSKNTIGDSNDVAIRVDELPAATVARLRKRHALDGALYAFAHAALDAAAAGTTDA
ncbi:hypothetical protein SO694_00072139 [Aureococcus anophagefferens]|uniref:Sulfotransferase domain-containing protein n=1 Tax=Aureococcus anophagefferens TaxID=44056 RepID=A0ABR1FIH0_AURAN